MHSKESGLIQIDTSFMLWSSLLKDFLSFSQQFSYWEGRSDIDLVTSNNLSCPTNSSVLRVSTDERLFIKKKKTQHIIIQTSENCTWIRMEREKDVFRDGKAFKIDKSWDNGELH